MNHFYCLLIIFHFILLLIAIPIVYELDADLKPIKHYYLADDETVKAAVEEIANQGKVKK
jgi:hypothetical protein